MCQRGAACACRCRGTCATCRQMSETCVLTDVQRHMYITQMLAYVYLYIAYMLAYICIYIIYAHIQIDKQIGRYIDRQIERQTDTYIHTYIHMVCMYVCIYTLSCQLRQVCAVCNASRDMRDSRMRLSFQLSTVCRGMCVSVCATIRLRLCVYTYIRLNIRIHTCIHTYIHTYLHIYAYMHTHTDVTDAGSSRRYGQSCRALPSRPQGARPKEALCTHTYTHSHTHTHTCTEIVRIRNSQISQNRQGQSVLSIGSSEVSQNFVILFIKA